MDRERSISQAGRCATRCAVFVACAITLCGCPPPAPPNPDAEPPPDAMILGRVVVELGGAAETLEDDVVLERLRLGVGEVRAHNDRGGALDPSRSDVGVVDVTSAWARVELEGAVPATYSHVSVTLAGGPALELRFVDEGVTYEVITAGPIAADVRCDLPIALPPAGLLALRASLDLGEIHAALREGTLPAPVDGVVRVDATSAPAVIADVEARVREHWQIDCGDDDDGDDG
ncbi:hypothetical protein [Sandaracinus amylolyticus]|uniref:hypothetical protein n=1 Tax=Sandaracinus amylolyticus TaxID=927083 RepID=UPI001F419433|nr:hypothetical protein [Sandaracinus amylolyticus]UJR84977.1 Hypothetical protein I5071_70560 [Sandaracinus amylolyticus]